jgi:hypothetical protein
MRREERKLRNIAQNKIAILDKPPALNQMLDGEQVYSRASGDNVRLYIRIGAKLYYTKFLPVEKESSNKWKDLD